MTEPFEDEVEEKGAVARILPPLVLIAAFGSFIALAIYAYQSGQSNVTADGELMIIEADGSAMKEKPTDPGGMQFPNQDKTVFENISGGAETQPQVERVLPTPEEPMAKDAESGEPATWINDKLANQAPAAAPSAGPESVFMEEKPAPAPEPKVVNVGEELAKQAVEESPVVDTKPVEIKSVPVAEKATQVKTVQAVKTETPKVTAPAGKQLAQLGAYKTDAEAKADFAKMQKKFPVLAGSAAIVNRADLGDKGIFYRLRVASSDAKALCAKLSGQACMVVK